jgi:NitT/TauT family transport system permease protein
MSAAFHAPAPTEAPVDTTARAEARRRKRRADSRAFGKLLALRLAFLAGVLALWELVVAVGWVEPFWISRPSRVILRIVELLPTQQLYTDAAFTMKSVLIGFLISAVAGIASACLLYKYRTLQKTVDPYILALYSMPRLALAPLFIIWFGVGSASKIALVVSLAYFIFLLNTYSGLVNVNPRLISQVRLMGASDWFIFRRVSLPASVPWLLSGARVALGFSLIGAIVGELIVAEQGLGLRIARASGLFDTTGVFAYLVIVAGLGMLFDQGVRLLEKSLAAWNGPGAP